MLRIQRKANAKDIFILSGRIEAEDIDELRRLFELEDASRKIALDLRDVTLVDRDGVSSDAACEGSGIQLENCPAYLREWIGRDSRPARQQRQNSHSDKQYGTEDVNGLRQSYLSFVI